MWATVVQLVVLDARRATVLLVLVVLVEMVLGAGWAGTEAVERIVVVVAAGTTGDATPRDDDVADSASPRTSCGELQPRLNVAEAAANASGATRGGRATSRV